MQAQGRVIKLAALEWMAVVTINPYGIARVRFTSPKPAGKGLQQQCEREARLRLKCRETLMEWAGVSRYENAIYEPGRV